MDEFERLAALHEYGLLDTPADEELSAVVRAAAVVAGVPTATLNLLDADRQCQLTTTGFAGADSPRQDSLCNVVVAGGEAVYTRDASADGRFAASPWVTGVLADVRFYASVPLTTPEGHVLGTLCVFHDQPVDLDRTRLDALHDLAIVVLALFERRRQARLFADLAAETEAQRELAARYAGELEVRQELINAVHETAGVAIVACDQDGHLTLFNRTARAWHGLEADAGLDPDQWSARYHLRAADGITPLNADDVPLRRALRGETVENVEMVIAPEDADPIRVLCTGRALRRADGTPLGAVVTMSDITAERTGREDIADRERLLASMLDTTTDACVATDSRGAVTAWNPAAEAMFGWRAAEAFGRRLTDLIIPERLRAAHDQGLARRAAGSEARLTGLVEVPAVRRDGSELQVELSLGSFTWRGERRFHAFLRDVTERAAARARLAAANVELTEANAELDRFTAMVAHDLKSPLTTITGYTELLAERDDERERVPLAAIGRAATRMRVMIDDLLDYARATHEPLDLRPVDAGETVDLLVDEMDPERSVRARVTRDVLPPLWTHPTLLRQVLANLIDNAVRYTAPDVLPRVHVSAQEGPAGTTIRVTDNGIGIAPESREDVFDLFHRERTGDGYRGTGIGLSTCRRIVERHGGRIWIEPGSERGTSVCFTVPNPVALVAS
ncbi:hypothetical protein GCM10022243_09560 [Saccharothrix violaceirubra]|uniref:Sensor-like histidine kinase SenX3 n=1 Tax=Saccharothrix violaceirubra TaxID=413306 RepID=A0A7W7T4L3_9PSEU|nr:PAS domain S-box protein [Saccharothrix violaceirubra]MBB4966206.1 PAS domain S-box-containing protein [Saccharothrix violaceirubra]